jgi:hypothetical protein
MCQIILSSFSAVPFTSVSGLLASHALHAHVFFAERHKKSGNLNLVPEPVFPGQIAAIKAAVGRLGAVSAPAAQRRQNQSVPSSIPFY